MGRGEVEARGRLVFNRRVVMELGPVVHGDGAHRTGFPANQLRGPARDGGGRALAELAEDQVAGLPFDQGQDTGPRLAGAEDGVAFPVPDLGAAFDDGRPLGDGALPGQPPAAIVAPVPLAALLAVPAQLLIQGAAFGTVAPDVGIERYMTNRESPIIGE